MESRQPSYVRYWIPAVAAMAIGAATMHFGGIAALISAFFLTLLLLLGAGAFVRAKQLLYQHMHEEQIRVLVGCCVIVHAIHPIAPRKVVKTVITKSLPITGRDCRWFTVELTITPDRNAPEVTDAMHWYPYLLLATRRGDSGDEMPCGLVNNIEIIEDGVATPVRLSRGFKDAARVRITMIVWTDHSRLNLSYGHGPISQLDLRSASAASKAK